MQIVTVTTVYRDATGDQKWVDYVSSTGVRGSADIKRFIEGMKGVDFKEGNFVIVANRYLRGKNCNLKFVEVMTCPQIIEKYPGYWIALKPFFLHPTNAAEDCGIVYKVMTGDEYDAFCRKCCANGTEEDYYFFHTSPNFQ